MHSWSTMDYVRIFWYARDHTDTQGRVRGSPKSKTLDLLFRRHVCFYAQPCTMYLWRQTSQPLPQLPILFTRSDSNSTDGEYDLLRGHWTSSLSTTTNNFLRSLCAVSEGHS